MGDLSSPVLSSLLIFSPGLSWICSKPLVLLVMEDPHQPRPQGLLLVQNGGQSNPWSRLPKWLQKFVTISSRKYDKMSSFRLNNSFQIAENKQGCHTLETTAEKAISSCVTWQNTPRFLEYFSGLGQGFLRLAILNEEKALGTRLDLRWGRTWIKMAAGSAERATSEQFIFALPYTWRGAQHTHTFRARV